MKTPDTEVTPTHEEDGFDFGSLADYKPVTMSRRKFLNKLVLGLSGAIGAILGVPVIGYLVAPLFEQTPEIWRDVGPVSNFQVGKTAQVKFMDASPLPWAGVTAQTAAWLRKLDEQTFIAYSVNCTHLGCPVSWLQDANLFMCPCHGGVYYSDGQVAAGPPPKPLSQYPVRIRNGRVEVRASQIPITS